MKSFFKRMKEEDGFTLVELMVVVAIIGLLSAVAVPNFKKYQAKAKISEAKLQLSAAYTAESAFFSDYNIYHHCLTYMGFDPGPESANRYYAIGFQNGAGAINGDSTTGAYGAAVNSGLNQTAGSGCANVDSSVSGAVGGPSTNAASWFPAGKGIGAAIASTNTFLPTTDLGDQSTNTEMSYVIGAGGVISADFVAPGATSQLTINQAKVLSNVTNGY